MGGVLRHMDRRSGVLRQMDQRRVSGRRPAVRGATAGRNGDAGEFHPRTLVFLVRVGRILHLLPRLLEDFHALGNLAKTAGRREGRRVSQSPRLARPGDGHTPQPEAGARRAEHGRFLGSDQSPSEVFVCPSWRRRQWRLVAARPMHTLVGRRGAWAPGGRSAQRGPPPAPHHSRRQGRSPPSVLQAGPTVFGACRTWSLVRGQPGR